MVEEYRSRILRMVVNEVSIAIGVICDVMAKLCYLRHK